MRVRSRKIDLMIVLLDDFAVHSIELCYDRTPLQSAIGIEVGNVPDDKMPGIECDGVSSLDEASEVRITTDQFLKH